MAPEAINAVLMLERRSETQGTPFQRSTYGFYTPEDYDPPEEYFYTRFKQYRVLEDDYNFNDYAAEDWFITNLPDTLAFLPINSIYKTLLSRPPSCPNYWEVRIAPSGSDPQRQSPAPRPLPRIPYDTVRRLNNTPLVTPGSYIARNSETQEEQAARLAAPVV